ncbi:hypothetical protein [Wenxinia saemankumensis]|nr:hypothetical protein [Wenxinia saemankumensis]
MTAAPPSSPGQPRAVEIANRRELLRRRFDRQFESLYRTLPFLRGPVQRIRRRGWWMVRVPLALLFIAGGFLAILPVFGLWMIPLGLFLLAIDLPILQGPVTAATIRLRRRFELLARRWRHRREG